MRTAGSAVTHTVRVEVGVSDSGVPMTVMTEGAAEKMVITVSDTDNGTGVAVTVADAVEFWVWGWVWF